MSKNILLPTRRLYNAYLRMNRKQKQNLQGGLWWWFWGAGEETDSLQETDSLLKKVKQELHQFMDPAKHDAMYLHRIDQNQTIINKIEAQNGDTNLHVVSLYLMAKHRKDCTPLGKDGYNELQWVSVWPDYLLDLHAITTWDDVFKPRLDVQFTTLQQFKYVWDHMSCNTNDRFIFIFLTLSTGVHADWRGHQNVLIYDVEKKELERFEPHGGGSSILTWCEDIEQYKTNQLVLQLHNEPCTEDSIDNAIVKHLKPIIGFETYYPPISFCPKIGFQSKTSLEKQGVDPGGFCFYWSIYYIDLRLSFPNKTRTQVIEDAMESIEDMFDVHEWEDFGSFIRSYAIFIDMLVKIVDARNLEGEALTAFINELIEEFSTHEKIA